MSSSRNRPIIRRAASGFTLVEMIVSLAIFVILAGAIFKVMEVSLQSSGDAARDMNRRQQRDGFIELCRATFRQLPGDATIECLGVQQQDNKYIGLMKIRSAPWIFRVGGDDQPMGNIALSARPQIGGNYTMNLGRSPLNSDQLSDDIANYKWMPLPTDLKDVQWRFFDIRSGVWNDSWNDTTSLPTLIELTLTMADDADLPTRAVFWIPPVVRNGQPVFPVASQTAPGATPPTTPTNAPATPTNPTTPTTPTAPTTPNTPVHT